ncbi:glycosyltransferase [Klebsiella quasipneumoniae]|uniref:glycosyltransferase family 4 protein n=1 Tax=Klebsiella quasipneumoniae TaxID=1463165 RepID=UPI0012511B40|nr:glycosyltransferase family 4 protein [Klebsiella quasipneumoniae]VAO25285.1 glycosyltransferase [Klebsiella quasipneumoniae]
MLFIQPHLTKYRIDFFNELSVLLKKRYNQKFKVICGETPKSFGVIEKIPFEVDIVKVKKVSNFFYFKEVFSKLKKEEHVIVHFGDFKYFTLYQSLYLSLFKRRVLYLHGQGGYKKTGLASRLLYNVVLFLTDGYICYNEFCSIELKKKTLPFLHKKIHHIDNTLYLEPVGLDKIIMEEKGNSVTFIGRVRERSGVENILEAAKIVSAQIPNFKIHIIGGGEQDYLHSLREKYPEAVFYGELYSQEDIIKVCSKSKAGIYGGDAGLSVVHYMSLGLPVIIHNDLYSHMGPEPSYIIDDYNGLLFERDNINSIAEKLLMLCKDDTLVEKLSKNSFESYIKLSRPTMAEKLIDIIEKDL